MPLSSLKCHTSDPCLHTGTRLTPAEEASKKRRLCSERSTACVLNITTSNLCPVIYVCPHRYSADTGRGDEQEKEAVLGENDSLWVDMRHLYIADVFTSLAEHFNEFHNKNKAAKQLGGGGWLGVCVL